MTSAGKSAVLPPEISVVLPVYNERDNIRPLADAIRAALDPLGRSYEIVFVDDGSTDGSLEEIKSTIGGGGDGRYLKFDRNYGQTAAMVAGLRAARGDLLVTLDADLQNDPADIPRLLSLLDEWDAVVGWRRKRNDSWLRRVSSRIANATRNWVTGDRVTDTGCSLKAYRRKCIPKLSMYRGMHRFLPTLLRMEGFSVTEIDVSHHPRRAGVSKYGVWNRLLPATLDLFAVRWMKSRHLDYHVEEESD